MLSHSGVTADLPFGNAQTPRLLCSFLLKYIMFWVIVPLSRTCQTRASLHRELLKRATIWRSSRTVALGEVFVCVGVFSASPRAPSLVSIEEGLCGEVWYAHEGSAASMSRADVRLRGFLKTRINLLLLGGPHRWGRGGVFFRLVR